jgi:hypothetical protein
MMMIMITDHNEWVDGHKCENNKYDILQLTKMTQAVKAMINNSKNEDQWQ